ncbi:MAG TPA: hypothetical protein VH583_06545 [Vicinamibacterales bacterium]|jgi:hypothetical protein
MNATAVGTVGQSRGWAFWLCVAVLVAATCDISYATGFSYLRSGVPPSRILQSVASGVLGRDAFQGGAPAAALGLVLHYVNAFLIAAIFFFAASRVPSIVRNPIVTGPIYGLIVYLVMNFVVIPMSRIGVVPHPPLIIRATEIPVHMFLIGLPIAVAARNAFVRA